MEESMIATIPQLLEALSNVPANRPSDGESWSTELDGNELVLRLDVDPWLIILFDYSKLKKLTYSSEWIYSFADGGDKLVFTRDIRL